MTEIVLKPCPFCGATDDNLSVANTGTCWVRCRIVDCHCEGPMCDNEANAVNAWNTRALPAQGEPVAWRWRPRGSKAWILYDETSEWFTNHADTIDAEPLYAALPSSPAPRVSSLNSGESEPSVMPAPGAGEAIFQECAEIALEHVGVHSYCSHLVTKDRMDGYDQACRDIADAIKLRASNRKTMDAIADAALLKP